MDDASMVSSYYSSVNINRALQCGGSVWCAGKAITHHSLTRHIKSTSENSAAPRETKICPGRRLDTDIRSTINAWSLKGECSGGQIHYQGLSPLGFGI